MSIGRSFPTEDFAAIAHSPWCMKHDPYPICECGENASCATCGWGKGAHPCSCERERLNALEPGWPPK